MAELAWPEDLGHGTFVGRFGFMDADSHDPDREPDITSATGGAVTITPSVKSVRYRGAGGPMILAARSARGIIDSEGYLCTAAEDGSAGARGMVFPATDDTDLTPTDWTYEVSIVLDGQVRIPAFHVKLPEGSTVDLSLAVPVPASGGTAVVVDPSTATRAEAAAVRAEAAADAAEDLIPTFEWDGTRLVVNGGEPVDLKGEKGSSAWADITGKPSSFPSTVQDVQGLTARLTALEYRSGVRSLSSLLTNATGTVLVERVGPMVTLALEAITPTAALSSGGTFITLPYGVRPTRRHDIHLITTATMTNRSGFVFTSGGIGVWQPSTSDRYRLVMTFATNDPIPATPPGTPA